jgi:hypothetical protein
MGGTARKADNLTAIFEPIVKVMWDPQRPTTLWAFTACYRDNFTFFYFLVIKPVSILKMERADS